MKGTSDEGTERGMGSGREEASGGGEQGRVIIIGECHGR